MSNRYIAALLCWAMALCGNAQAQETNAEDKPAVSLPGATHSVSENIHVFMRRGPSNQYKLIGSVNAGEPLILTGEAQGDYTQVTDSRGRTGWLQNKEIQAGESFRTKVPALQSELGQTQEALTAMTAERDALQNKEQELTERLDQQFQELNARNEQQAQELSQVQQQNQELTAEVAKLRQEERFIWLQQGGMVAGAGLLVGLILAYLPRPQRRKRRDGWA